MSLYKVLNVTKCLMFPLNVSSKIVRISSKHLSFFLPLQVLQVAPSAPVDVTISPVLSVLLVNARASLLSGNATETMTVGTTVMKMAAVRIPSLTCVWEK